jgi:hypothetical protein
VIGLHHDDRCKGTWLACTDSTIRSDGLRTKDWSVNKDRGGMQAGADLSAHLLFFFFQHIYALVNKHPRVGLDAA